MWLALLFFLSILFLLAYLDTKKPKNYPPGPKWLPIFGSALTVNNLRKKTGYLYLATAELAKIYGPVVGLKIGADKQVIAYGYEAIKQMLTDDDFSGRPTGIFYKARTWGIRRGVLLTDEEFWQEQRRFVLKNLRDFGFGKRNMGAMIESEAEDLVKTVMSKLSKENTVILPMENMFGVSVLNTLWMMMAGVRYNPEDKEMKTLQGLLTELFASIDMCGCLFSQFPFLRFVAPEYSGYKVYLHTHIQVWNFLRKELENHKKTFKSGSPRDFMDVYIEMLNSKDKKDSFSESQLMAVCMDLFMAGSETTSKTLGFCFLYLLLYPDVQQKVHDEIDHVVGRDRAPLLTDRMNMPYTEALVLESLRMFMGRTFTVPHRALRDTNLQGYFVPKDTMVIANMNGCLLTKSSVFKDPEVFRPERFIKDNKIIIPESFLPFGFGKHRCMGETLAKANLFLLAASMLQRFKFCIPPGHPKPSTEVIDGVTPAPKPYQALITLRF